MNTIQNDQIDTLHVLTLSAPDHLEYFFTVTPGDTDTPEAMLSRLAAAANDVGAQLVAVDVFGGLGSGADKNKLLGDVFGDVAFPVTWVEEKSGAATHLAGIQAWGVAGAPVQPLFFEGRVSGAFFDTEFFRYCRLGGITPTDTARPVAEQASAVFRHMDAALRLSDMHFNQVVRTWFYNHQLLDWYDVFNTARDVFFREHRVYDNLVPASTGIEGGNPAGAALVAGALAVAPCKADAGMCAVPSPLQCPALEYGSSFSRATEVYAPGSRRLYISGTASISPDGDTQYEGDVAAQIKRTMEVATAILQSREMDLTHTTRATVYFKNAEDFPAFEAWRSAANAPRIPLVFVHNDVCRDDLLFEIELDAVGVDV